jgi:hypothetical protein
MERFTQTRPTLTRELPSTQLCCENCGEPSPHLTYLPGWHLRLCPPCALEAASVDARAVGAETGCTGLEMRAPKSALLSDIEWLTGGNS